MFHIILYNIICCGSDDCEEDTDCGSHGKCLRVTHFSYPQKQCFCQPGYYGLRCERGELIVRVTSSVLYTCECIDVFL